MSVAAMRTIFFLVILPLILTPLVFADRWRDGWLDTPAGERWARRRYRRRPR